MTETFYDADLGRLEGRAVAVIGYGNQGQGPHGQLKLWPRVKLPLAWWPDLLEDASSLCRMVVDQTEPGQENARRRRTRWIERLREGQAPPEKSEGKRLCLQTDRGEVWAMIWERGPLEVLGKTRQEEKRELKRLAEDVGWDELDAPLTFIDDRVWIVLHEGQGSRTHPGLFGISCSTTSEKTSNPRPPCGSCMAPTTPPSEI